MSQLTMMIIKLTFQRESSLDGGAAHSSLISKGTISFSSPMYYAAIHQYNMHQFANALCGYSIVKLKISEELISEPFLG